jgi:DNA replication protein DnaC
MDSLENKPDTTSVPANDTAVEKQLADYVHAKRQSLPALPGRLELPGDFLATPPEVLEKREADYARRCEDRRRAEIYQRWVELVANAGARYRECTLENFQCKHPAQKTVLTNVLAYTAADCPENLILYGPVGTGKDHLAFAVCREAARAGKTVRWINGQSWFGILRDSMDTNRSEASLVSELSRPDLLCLSDPLPPMGPLTQYQSTMLYRLVDARYSRGVPTVCTVNVAGDEEADSRIGAATWDRLCHGAYKLRCQWETFRKPIREV